MTDLMQHTMNIFGATKGFFQLDDIKCGMRFEKIQWNGCMATDRDVIGHGVIIRAKPSPHNNGKYAGFTVRYQEDGERWEPADHFRFVGGKLECWI